MRIVYWRARKTWMAGADPRIKSGDGHDDLGIIPAAQRAGKGIHGQAPSIRVDSLFLR
jgi:hypothetical protein